MTTLPATPTTLAALLAARKTAENELRKMHRINHAFTAGRNKFLQHGSLAEYKQFADTIRNNPTYGAVPFPPRLLLAKTAQLERLNKQIIIARRLLAPAKAG